VPRPAPFAPLALALAAAVGAQQRVPPEGVFSLGRQASQNLHLTPTTEVVTITLR
jgi:hypothetical protein